MDDLISRQAAIDTLMEILDRPNHAEFLYTDEICKALGELPSAQPEIIRCKDCKHWMRAYLDISGKFGCNIMRDYTAPNDYCFKAERKE